MNQVKSSSKFPLQSILLDGSSGSGMTAIAAELGRRAEFPFTKLISPEDFIGWTEQARCNKIAKVRAVTFVCIMLKFIFVIYH